MLNIKKSQAIERFHIWSIIDMARTEMKKKTWGNIYFCVWLHEQEALFSYWISNNRYYVRTQIAKFNQSNAQTVHFISDKTRNKPTMGIQNGKFCDNFSSLHSRKINRTKK